jgi:hypothetical protein
MLSVVRMVTATISVCALAATGCLGASEGTPDARSYDEVTADGRPLPWFRDAGSCGGGASGTSGASSGVSGGCGTSGLGGAVDAAPPDAAPCDYVVFEYTNSTATSVWLTGDFTGWATSPVGGALVLSNSGGTWTRGAQIGPGRHLYKLVIDGTDWIADPGNAQQESDGFGGYNSVIEVCGGSPE